MPAIMWFRRDLRLRDNPALAAAASGQNVIGLFVLDPVLWHRSGPVRREWLRQSLHALNEQLDGNLWLAAGNPVTVVPELAAQTNSSQVYLSKDFGTYGKQRDDRVREALALSGRDLIEAGSPYAIDPGTLATGSGTRYRVYAPFYRSWLSHGYPAAAPTVVPEWVTPPPSARIDAIAELSTRQSEVELPDVGEVAAWRRWEWFKDNGLAQYSTNRNRPDLDGTSNLSAHLRWGEIHPRSLLAELPPYLSTPDCEVGAETFRKEIAWREFYAEVWDANPTSTWDSLDPRFDRALETDSGSTAEANFAAWQLGLTGYPFVDAGMRQLRATGWMHNRVRMITASFLVKSLHLPWQRGANEFLYWLRDGDAASNQHGWQWVAGCGTDAAPFHRIFNPIKQGLTFDPSGDYVRRWVPELREIPGAAVHEPWLIRGTLAEPANFNYPAPIVDHSVERQEALARFAVLPPRNG